MACLWWAVSLVGCVFGGAGVSPAVLASLMSRFLRMWLGAARASRWVVPHPSACAGGVAPCNPQKKVERSTPAGCLQEGVRGTLPPHSHGATRTSHIGGPEARPTKGQSPPDARPTQDQSPKRSSPLRQFLGAAVTSPRSDWCSASPAPAPRARGCAAARSRASQSRPPRRSSLSDSTRAPGTSRPRTRPSAAG